MNKKRRKKIQRIARRLQDALDDLEHVKEDEEEAYYNLPENLQEGDRGELMYANILMMEDALGYLEGIISDLEELWENEV